MDHQRAPQDRPAFPEDAVTWLAGASPRSVVVLGSPEVAAGFVGVGHDVTELATDAGPLPFPDRSVDVVLSVQGAPTDLAETARVLRPGGQLALVWNERDQRIPWSRKLNEVLGTTSSGEDPEAPVVTSARFGFVEERSFRYWQTVTGESLEALARDELADATAETREERVRAARALYDDYGRGIDGMRLPWVSRCFRASVLEAAWASPRGLDGPSYPTADDTGEADDRQPTAPPVEGDGADLLLIDFR